MVSGARERQRPWRETAATFLTAKQYFQIATVYESAAADKMMAFVRKARWFHMLARIKAAKEAAVVLNEPQLMGPIRIDKPARMQCGHKSRTI